ncbi:hypothetical protein NE237_008875 [Protea cynaroides]|uniref:Secreted protein n=1 Tax=Protea cynaroides TaxID=273540 RepID=A0A9Q0KWN2_9MAGN|nr:hypothetical protein NE237_008875 [Protea cynaroides]
MAAAQKGRKKGFFWFLLTLLNKGPYKAHRTAQLSVAETHTARRSQAKDFLATKDVSTTIASKTEETILSKTGTSRQKLSTSIAVEFMYLPKIQKQRERKKQNKHKIAKSVVLES